MPGLVPGIHAVTRRLTLGVSQRRRVRTIAAQSPWDDRDKPGHDGESYLRLAYLGAYEIDSGDSNDGGEYFRPSA